MINVSTQWEEDEEEEEAKLVRGGHHIVLFCHFLSVNSEDVRVGLMLSERLTRQQREKFINEGIKLLN